MQLLKKLVNEINKPKYTHYIEGMLYASLMILFLVLAELYL